MNGQNLSIGVIGVGACTAVGLTAPFSAAAVRTGFAGFTEHPELVDQEGEPLIVARLPSLAKDVTGIDRFLQLALPAAKEALNPLVGPKVGAHPISVVVGLPAPRPGLPESLGNRMAERFKHLVKDQWPVSSIETLSTGHSGGLMALEAGWRRIQSGSDAFCLVGGIDSYLEPETLTWLESSDQLHGAGTHNNAWGFTPGEAAGFCLLCTEGIAEKHGLRILSRVLTATTAREKNLIKTESVCLGQGLTEAFRQVFPALPSPNAKIDQVICDMNGEAYRADEYGFTIARTSQRFVAAGDFLAPADCWGDVGAASGPLFVSLVIAAAGKGYSKGPHTLLWTSSESGERSAALLRTDRQPKGRG